MKVSTTEFRKDLYQIMDRVLKGELVEVIHKGNIIRLTPPASQSKMSRLIRRDTLVCDPDQLEEARRELQGEMRSEMEEDWT